MRARITGLLLALILLTAASPSIFDCCFGSNAGRGASHALANANTNAAAPTHAPSTHRGTQAAASAPLAEPVARDESARGCIDRAGPVQTPYIENSGGGRGGSPATRSTDAAISDSIAALADATRSARHVGTADEDTGPPLWLTTCVSRT